jgi:ABC-2 type transport system permease protein
MYILAKLAGALQTNLHSQIEDPAMAEMAASQARLGVLQKLFEVTDEGTLRALAKIPLIVFIGFRASLFFAPIWIALLGYDVVSEELSTRSIRYVTVRARKSLLVVGKYLALGTILVGLFLAVNVALLLYARQGSPDFSGGLWLVTLGRCWAAGSLFALGYLGLTLLCSTLAKPPSLALALNLLALLGLWVLDVMGSPGLAAPGSDSPESARAFLQWITPSHYGPLLLHPDPKRFAVGAAAFAVFIALTVAGAAFSLERRDV